MIAFASSLDQAGTLTHSAEDAAIMLNIMAGFDEKDSTCVDLPVPDYCATLNKPLTGLRIGIPRQHFAEGLQPELRPQQLRVQDWLRLSRRLGGVA